MESESARVRRGGVIEIFNIEAKGWGQVLLRVSVTTYQTVVCPGNVMFDEEFISREAFGIDPSQERLRSGGGGFGGFRGVQICHGVHVVSCHLVDTRSTHWLT